MVYSRPTSQDTHYHTHPLPSRVTSPLGGQRSPQHSPPEAVDRGTGYMTTPPPATPLPATPTPLMNIDQSVPDGRPHVQKSGGMRTSRRRSSSVPTNKICSCPVYPEHTHTHTLSLSLSLPLSL